MSVAENPVTEQVPRNPQQQLAIHSTIGAVVVLAGLGFIFSGLPMLWALFWDAYLGTSLGMKENPFLGSAILILIEILAIAGLAYGAYLLVRTQKQPGVRAGIVFAAFAIFLSLWIGVWLGDLLADQFDDNPTLGWIIIIGVVGALLAGIGYLYAAVPAWSSLLQTIEEQGWFHATSYKGNQGVRVRRGTIVGVLAIGGFGIASMVLNHFFGTERVAEHEYDWILYLGDSVTRIPFGNDWVWLVPYTRHLNCIPLMFKVHLLMPLVLVVILFWFAWRVVNVPPFADFLIATEAEMNKVSWTSRRRLIQDTIVVLVTVVLLTTFLFVVDVLWIRILSAPGIKVLLYDPRDQQQKQQEKAQW